MTDTSTEHGSAVRVENLHTVYRNGDRETSVVRGVSFSVQRGEIVGLVGESGSGKSTVLKSILDLLGTKGEARADVLEIAGRDLRTIPAAQLRKLRTVEMAVVAQDPINAFNPSWTIGSQFRRVLKRHAPGKSRKELDAWSLELLAGVGIDGTGKLKSYPVRVQPGPAAADHDRAGQRQRQAAGAAGRRAHDEPRRHDRGAGAPAASAGCATSATWRSSW